MEAAISANILKKVLRIFRFIQSLKEIAFNERKGKENVFGPDALTHHPSIVQELREGRSARCAAEDGSGDRALAPTVLLPRVLVRERGRDRLHPAARQKDISVRLCSGEGQGSTVRGFAAGPSAAHTPFRGVQILSFLPASVGSGRGARWGGTPGTLPSDCGIRREVLSLLCVHVVFVLDKQSREQVFLTVDADAAVEICLHTPNASAANKLVQRLLEGLRAWRDLRLLSSCV